MRKPNEIAWTISKICCCILTSILIHWFDKALVELTSHSLAGLLPTPKYLLVLHKLALIACSSSMSPASLPLVLAASSLEVERCFKCSKQCTSFYGFHPKSKLHLDLKSEVDKSCILKVLIRRYRAVYCYERRQCAYNTRTRKDLCLIVRNCSRIWGRSNPKQISRKHTSQVLGLDQSQAPVFSIPSFRMQ